MTKEKKTIEEKNIAYFSTLANSRASLTQLRIALVAGVPIGLLLIWLLNQASIYAHIAEFKSLINIFIFLTVITGGIGVCSLSNKLLYKFQKFFSLVLCIFIIILTLFVFMLFYFMSLYIKANTMFSPSGFYGRTISALSLSVLIVSMVVNILLIHHRLKVGFSETRTSKNFLAISGAYSPKTLVIIFVSVVIVPNILTQGRYLLNVFGIICLLGISIIFPNLIVEFSYLAYLKTKNKKFWEGKPSSKNWGLDGSVSSVNNKKRMKYKLIIVLYIILSIAFFYLTGTVYGNQAYPIIIRIIGLLILVSYSILFSVWIIKKIKERRNK